MSTLANRSHIKTSVDAPTTNELMDAHDVFADRELGGVRRTGVHQTWVLVFGKRLFANLP